jgi:hypothetical protein
MVLEILMRGSSSNSCGQKRGLWPVERFARITIPLLYALVKDENQHERKGVPTSVIVCCLLEEAAV